MWLGTMGITGLSGGQVQSALAGLLFILASIFVPFFGILALCDTALAQTGGPTQSPPGAAVYFIGLKDGDTLPTKSTIHFGLRGMGVAPAGSDRANSGHHHLMVDVPTPALDHGKSCGWRTNPALTGLSSMYARIFSNSLRFRTQ